VGWLDRLGGKKRHKKKSGIHKAGDAVEDATGCLDDCTGGCMIMIVPVAVLGAALYAGAKRLRAEKG
jgi:hypothetical protein